MGGILSEFEIIGKIHEFLLMIYHRVLPLPGPRFLLSLKASLRELSRRNLSRFDLHMIESKAGLPRDLGIV
jgi:hypothetical protein